MSTSTTTAGQDVSDHLAPADAGAGLRGAIAFERIKLLSLRSTLWSVVVALALMVIIGVVVGMSMAASGDNGFDVTRPAPHAAMDGLALAQLPVLAIATLLIASEYSTRSIITTLQSVPLRGRMLLAKLVVVLVLSFLSGVLLCLVGTAAVAPLAGDYGDFVLSDLVWTTVGAGGYLALLGAITLGLGTLLRSAAGTITAITMLLLAVPPLLRVTTLDWLNDASDYLPDTAGNVLLTQDNDPYGWITAVLVLVVWAGLCLGAGYARLRTRDA
ncbi:hypothetical protein [Modestobacter sp. SYSU DS0875]